MVDLKKMKDMDRMSGRPEQVPKGSGMIDMSKMHGHDPSEYSGYKGPGSGGVIDIDGLRGQGLPTRPPMDLPRQEKGDTQFGDKQSDDSPEEHGIDDKEWLNMLFGDEESDD